MSRIVVVDYGLGNLRSVSKALEKTGAQVQISARSEDIRSADGIVLPGVGAFREGMEKLADLSAALIDAEGQVPILGICLGMQMLLEFSEEHGLHKGLGLIPGTARRFKDLPGYKIPHMGWNQLKIERGDDQLLSGIQDGAYFYFVHSYWADVPLEYQITSTEYINQFASSIHRGTAWGTQFHPEKSGDDGLSLIRNFVDIID